jgi:magnesium transporter
MFRVLTVPEKGKLHTSEGDKDVRPPHAGAFRWIDLQDQDDETLELLKQRFDFHPLAIEDCANFDQRPKLEEYGTYLFIVSHALSCTDPSSGELDIHEVHAFLGERYLVTVHTAALEPLDAVWDRLAGDDALAGRGADFVYYLVADRMVDTNFPLLDRIADELETLESDVLSNPHPDQLATMFKLKRLLVAMRKTLSPQRDVFGMLAKRGGDQVSDKTSIYFRDIFDHLVRLNESIEAGRDLLGNCFDAYLSSVSNRTNQIMKSLTIMSAVFLPLAFVVGFFGMNFEDLPLLPHWMQSDALMYVMLATCLAIPLGMLLWFHRSRWI